MSEDQKQSSAVAKVHYQKQRSREVAVKAHERLQKVQGTKGSEVDEEVKARFSISKSAPATAVENAAMEITPQATADDPPIEHSRSQRTLRRVMKFRSSEDDFLKNRIDRHGFREWTAILRDPDFKFQEGRTADSLKKRVGLKFSLGPCT